MKLLKKTRFECAGNGMNNISLGGNRHEQLIKVSRIANSRWRGTRNSWHNKVLAVARAEIREACDSRDNKSAVESKIAGDFSHIDGFLTRVPRQNYSCLRDKRPAIIQMVQISRTGSGSNNSHENAGVLLAPDWGSYGVMTTQRMPVQPIN